MDDTAAEIIERETILADFDHARDDFEQAFAQVPDEALDFKPEGDDYDIAGLIPHITGSLVRYARLVDDIRQSDYSDFREEIDPAHAELMKGHRALRAGISPAVDRRAALDEMEAAHDRLASKLRD